MRLAAVGLVCAGLLGCGRAGPLPAATGATHSHPAQSHAAQGHPAHAHPTHHHDFHDVDRWTKVFDDPARDSWQRPAAIVDAMAIEPGSTVVDLGAGTGYFEPYLSRAVGPNGHVVALDLEPAMVQRITERARQEGLTNVTARLVKADDPALEAGSVSRILVVDTWHHIEHRRAYAEKLAAALAPKGVLYIVDFTKESPFGPPADARLAPDEVAAELESAGLRPARVTVGGGGLPHQYVIAGKKAGIL